MTHIFYKTSNPSPLDHAICFYFKRGTSQPLDDYGQLCEDCMKMANAILRSSGSKKETQK